MGTAAKGDAVDEKDAKDCLKQSVFAAIEVRSILTEGGADRGGVLLDPSENRADPSVVSISWSPTEGAPAARFFGGVTSSMGESAVA